MIFLDNFSRHGDAVALSDPKLGDISYGQLAAEVDAWRRRFDRMAEDLGARVLLSIEIAPCTAVIAAYLGALSAGHPVILLAPGQTRSAPEIANRYLPNAVLTMAGGACHVTVTDAGPVALHPDLRLLLSTSGTTGDPRLVRLSQENLSSNAAAIVDYLKLGVRDVGITALPLHYSYGMSVLHTHLLAGARLVLTEASVTDPAFAQLYRENRITNLPLVPHQIDLLQAMGFDFNASADLRLITQAGGRLAADKVRDFGALAVKGGWDFYVMYGQTEASPRMAYVPPGDLPANSDTIGKAIPGGRLWIAGPDGTEVTQPGMVGELVYEGPNVMLGYADKRADLALGREITDLRTGDIAEQTSSGYFRIVGREKRFVKLYGLRLSLDQIEIQLAGAGMRGHAVAVNDRLVIMTPPDTAGPAVAAFLSTAFALPRSDILVAEMPELPILTSGKADLRRIACLAEAALARTERATTPPKFGKSVPGQTLADVFSEATRIPVVRPDDSFQSLGGDSLAYLRVVLALEERLGVVPNGWESTPVSELDHLQPRPRPAMGRLEPDVVLRLLAVCCVILTHLNYWPLSGGTWLLVVLIGFTLARGQSRLLAEGAYRRVALNLAYPILPIYFVIIISYEIIRGHVPLRMFLLIGNYGGKFGAPLLEPLWFISLYTQVIIGFLLIFSVPTVRRAAAADFFRFAAIGFAATLLFLIACNYTPLGVPLSAYTRNGDGPTFTLRSLPLCAPLVFLGWMIFYATTVRKKAITATAIVASCFLFLVTPVSYQIIVSCGATWLIIGAGLPLPSAVARFARQAAAATLFVYLLHNSVIHAIKYATPLHEILGPMGAALIGVPICYGLGMIASGLFDLAERKIRRARQPQIQAVSDKAL